MIESSLVTYKNKIIDYNKGSNVSVEFSFEKIWNYKMKLEQNQLFHPKNLHFIHVHPENLLTYSNLDLNCIRGLTIAFAYPVNFSIIVFNNKNINDIDYNQVCYKYKNNKMTVKKNITIKEEFIIILKLLSYI